MSDSITPTQSPLLRQVPATGQHPGLYVFGTASSLGMAMFVNQLAATNGYATERNDRNA